MGSGSLPSIAVAASIPLSCSLVRRQEEQRNSNITAVEFQQLQTCAFQN